MINVEGDYDEIVAYLNANPVAGIGFVGEHGIYEEDSEDYHYNVGLFSLVETHTDDPEDCPACYSGSSLYVCNFSEPLNAYMKKYWHLKENDLEPAGIRF